MAKWSYKIVSPKGKTLLVIKAKKLKKYRPPKPPMGFRPLG